MWLNESSELLSAELPIFSQSSSHVAQLSFHFLLELWLTVLSHSSSPALIVPERLP